MKVSIKPDQHTWHPSVLPGQVVLVTTVDPDDRPHVAVRTQIAMAAVGPPPVLMIPCTIAHSTAANARRTGEFVVNIPGDDLAATTWEISSEGGEAGRGLAQTALTPMPAEKMKAPRIAECRAHLECRVDGVQQWGSELERSVRFYEKAFGWPELVRVPVYVELATPEGRRLGLYQREGFARNTGHLPEVVPVGGTSATESYLHSDDLDLTIHRLRAVGARVLSDRAPRDWGDEAAYFADPDGNVIVVACPLPDPVAVEA